MLCEREEEGKRAEGRKEEIEGGSLLANRRERKREKEEARGLKEEQEVETRKVEGGGGRS